MTDDPAGPDALRRLRELVTAAVIEGATNQNPDLAPILERCEQIPDAALLLAHYAGWITKAYAEVAGSLGEPPYEGAVRRTPEEWLPEFVERAINSFDILPRLDIAAVEQFLADGGD